MADEIIFVNGQSGEVQRFGGDADIQSRLAPNLGQPPIPPVVTYAGIFSGGSHTFRPSDEALQHSWQNAQYMRQDVAVMEPLEVRKRAVALLDWHIEPEDEEDPQQKELADTITWLIKRIPNFLQYREVLLDAIFFGRYAVYNTCRWYMRNGKPLIGIARWRPLHGDKLVWRWDDGTGDFDPDCVGIRISAATTVTDTLRRWEEFARKEGGEILPTHLGLAYFPRPEVRELIIIHRHTVEDGDFYSPQNAARIFGVGIRNRIYWTWYQKQEALAWLMEFLERSAFGIELWYYPAGSEKAKEDMVSAATERIGNARNVLIIPRPPGPEGAAYGVDLIQPNMAGAAAIKEIITEYFGHQIKRYILGQTLTTEAHPTGLGSNLASIHLDTFLQIVKYDAVNLQETLTHQLVARLVKWNFPHIVDCPLRFVIETDKPDAQERLQAIHAAYAMGLSIRARDVRALLGLAQPGPADEILSARGGGPGGAAGGPGENPNLQAMMAALGLADDGPTPRPAGPGIPPV